MIFLQLTQQLGYLSSLLLLLNDEQYSHKIEYLGNASIGGHTRHIIELIQCAIDGYFIGEVDYFNRTRDIALEEDRLMAQETLQELTDNIRFPDKKLNMRIEIPDGSVKSFVSTTYFREIVYNTEHAIHHLALIKVALIAMKLNVTDKDFGMAYSTIKYKASLNT